MVTVQRWLTAYRDGLLRLLRPVLPISWQRGLDSAPVDELLMPGERVAVRVGIQSGWTGVAIRPARFLGQSAWLVEFDGDSRPKRSRVPTTNLRPVDAADDEWTGRRPWGRRSVE